MNYKSWGKRKKLNRGRGRGNWNWRGRGHNRMQIPNSFVQSHGWPNSSTNYTNYHSPHQESNSYYYNPRQPRPTHPVPRDAASPLPGSEEYTQNKIQHTSDLIKRQLNIDSETCSLTNISEPCHAMFSEFLNNNKRDDTPDSDVNLESLNLSENKRMGKQQMRRCETPESIDVQEIHDKIIKHISNLSYSKKISLVHQSTSGYDIAMQEVQRQKRLELSRALRDMSKRESQSSGDGEVINAIIPDIGIKIEDLPNDVIAELSNCLNFHLDDQINSLIDPELYFKQAEEILNVNFERDDNYLKLPHSDYIMGSTINNSNRNTTAPENRFALDDNLFGESEYYYGRDASINDETNVYKSDPHDDNNDSDPDFYFKNIDVNKSYLTPFSSTSNPSSNFVKQTNIFEPPKISVRKDILQDGDIDYNLSRNSETLFEARGSSNKNTAFENTKSSIDNNLVPSDRNINCNNQSNETIPQIPSGTYSNRVDSNIAMMKEFLTSGANVSSPETHIDESHHKSPLNTLQSPENLIPNQDSNVCNIIHPFEHYAQKRWKSPGEKKMMTDIRPNSNVVAIAPRCLSALENITDISVPVSECSRDEEDTFSSVTRFAETKEYPTKEDSTEKCRTDLEESSNTSPILEKHIETNSVDVSYQTDENIIGSTSDVPSQQSSVKIESMNRSSNSKDNIREKHPHTKYKKTKSAHSKTDNRAADVPIGEDISKDTTDIVNVKNKIEKVEVPRVDKEYRKVKTAAEKKETMPITKIVTSICTQTEINEHSKITQTSWDPIPAITVKTIHTQTTLENKTKEKNSKAIQTKRIPLSNTVCTQTNLKTKTELKRSIDVQTDSEPILEDTKNELKEFRSIEVQASNTLASSSAQTDGHLEYCNNQQKYLDYFMKLKEIDAKIEKLMETKKDLYDIMESDLKSSNAANTTIITISQVDLPKVPETKPNVVEAMQQEQTRDEPETISLSKKHKRTDSDNGYEENMHNPKKKKRHKSSKKNASSSSTSTSGKTSSSKLSNEEICDDERKPLSIKISLKNLMPASMKREIEEAKKVRDENVSKHGTRKKSPEQSCASSMDTSIGQDSVAEKPPQIESLSERKLEAKDTSIAKATPTNKSPLPIAENDTAVINKDRKNAKVKSKKIKAYRHNLKLSDEEDENVSKHTTSKKFPEESCVTSMDTDVGQDSAAGKLPEIEASSERKFEADDTSTSKVTPSHKSPLTVPDNDTVLINKDEKDTKVKSKKLKANKHHLKLPDKDDATASQHASRKKSPEQSRVSNIDIEEDSIAEKVPRIEASSERKSETEDTSIYRVTPTNRSPLNVADNDTPLINKDRKHTKVKSKKLKADKHNLKVFDDDDERKSKHTATKKSPEESYVGNMDTDIEQDSIAEKLPQIEASTERKLEIEDTSISEENPRSKSPFNISDDDTTSINRDKKNARPKSKKLKPNKQNLNSYNLKLSDEDYERIFNKKCHVRMERHGAGYLEELRKKIHKCKIGSQNENISTQDVEHVKTADCSPDHQLDVASDTQDAANIVNVSSNLDTSDVEFKNFMGVVLDIKVIQDIVLAATDTGCLYCFEINTGDIASTIKVSEKPLTSIYVVTNSEAITVYLGCLMGTLTMLDFETKKITNTVQCEEGIQCLEHKWEYIFMGSHKGHVMRYNLKKNKLEQSLKIYDSNILAIKATQEGARRVILVASRNTQITVRDAMSGLLMRVMDSTFNPTVYTILLDNNLVYCGTSQHDILVYTFQDGQLSYKYEVANSKGIVCLKIAGDFLFAGCYNGNIYVYTISTKKYIGQISGPGGMLLSMDICGNKIIVGTKSNKLKSLTIPQVLLDQSSS